MRCHKIYHCGTFYCTYVRTLQMYYLCTSTSSPNYKYFGTEGVLYMSRRRIIAPYVLPLCGVV
uniref:Uncharacterized protein n=1 Tax=Aegilops tauschii subsp. strangulata TaxID=200361 RepID=A0A452ZCP3_AEGTS